MLLKLVTITFLLCIVIMQVKDPETGKKVDDYWDSAKKQLLADAKQFMESLVHFDKDNIPLHIIKKVTSYSYSIAYHIVYTLY
jgi:hypothetical protein